MKTKTIGTAMMVAAAMMMASPADAGFRSRAAKASKESLSCGSGLKIVSYRFVGPAGSSVTYANRTFKIPASGSIEVVASKEVTSYASFGSSKQIANGEIDGFGIMTIDVQSNAVLAALPVSVIGGSDEVMLGN